MSCKKHPKRKRKGCPDCFPVEKKTTKVKAPVVKEEKTSREMLADAIEEEELVIKPQRAVKPKKEVPPVAEVKEEKEELPPTFISEFEKKIQEVVDKVYSKLIEKIDAVSDVRWEHIEWPGEFLTMHVIDNLETEGWKWCHYYDEQWGKAAGINVKPHHLFQRIVHSKWPAKPDLSKPEVLAKYSKKKGK